MIRRFIIFGIILGLILNSCDDPDTKQKRISNKNNIGKKLQNSEIDITKSEYLEIKKLIDKGYFLDIDRLISQFIDGHKDSPYYDSVQIVADRLATNRTKLKQNRDSLSKLSAFHYFNDFDLPRLDSISYSDYDLIEHNYKLDFTDFDKKIFKTDWEQNWYLSKEYANHFICIAICHFNDCDNKIVLYSIDSSFNIIDKEGLFDNGCYAEYAPDFRYGKYLVNEQKRYSASYFHNDTTFSKINRVFFTLKDTTTNELTIEVGDEYNVTYRIDTKGKFKIVEDKSFKKDYVEPLYKVAI
ncbi:MAG: hypothetical protein ABFS35_21965 [Bacteroidota bacterium]